MPSANKQDWRDEKPPEKYFLNITKNLNQQPISSVIPNVYSVSQLAQDCRQQYSLVPMEI
jgi:hypothetical protein